MNTHDTGCGPVASCCSSAQSLQSQNLPYSGERHPLLDLLEPKVKCVPEGALAVEKVCGRSKLLVVLPDFLKLYDLGTGDLLVSQPQGPNRHGTPHLKHLETSTGEVILHFWSNVSTLQVMATSADGSLDVTDPVIIEADRYIKDAHITNDGTTIFMAIEGGTLVIHQLYSGESTSVSLPEDKVTLEVTPTNALIAHSATHSYQLSDDYRRLIKINFDTASEVSQKVPTSDVRLYQNIVTELRKTELFEEVAQALRTALAVLAEGSPETDALSPFLAPSFLEDLRKNASSTDQFAVTVSALCVAITAKPLTHLIHNLPLDQTIHPSLVIWLVETCKEDAALALKALIRSASATQGDSVREISAHVRSLLETFRKVDVFPYYAQSLFNALYLVPQSYQNLGYLTAVFSHGAHLESNYDRRGFFYSVLCQHAKFGEVTTSDCSAVERWANPDHLLDAFEKSPSRVLDIIHLRRLAAIHAKKMLQGLDPVPYGSLLSYISDEKYLKIFEAHGEKGALGYQGFSFDDISTGEGDATEKRIRLETVYHHFFDKVINENTIGAAPTLALLSILLESPKPESIQQLEHFYNRFTQLCPAPADIDLILNKVKGVPSNYRDVEFLTALAENSPNGGSFCESLRHLSKITSSPVTNSPEKRSRLSRTSIINLIRSSNGDAYKALTARIYSLIGITPTYSALEGSTDRRLANWTDPVFRENIYSILGDDSITLFEFLQHNTKWLSEVRSNWLISLATSRPLIESHARLVLGTDRRGSTTPYTSLLNLYVAFSNSAPRAVRDQITPDSLTQAFGRHTPAVLGEIEKMKEHYLNRKSSMTDEEFAQFFDSAANVLLTPGATFPQ